MLGTENFTFITRSSCSSSTWTFHHRNLQTIYGSTQHSTHITNLIMISSNSNYMKRIESNKFCNQKFKSRYLAQILMELHDSSCSMLYVLRSIKAIWRFQELTWSNSHLMKMQMLNSSSSRPGLSKQMRNDVEEDEWSQIFSSTMLRFEGICNCHMNVHSSTVPIQHEFSTILLQFNATMPADEG